MAVNLNQSHDDRRPFFTPKTLAAILVVSERTVRQMIADSKIASYKIAGQRRVAAADIDAYLAAHRTDRKGA
jgi:excisionase family DNA binding protein